MNKKAKKILIIDDDSILSSLYKTKLESEGLSVFIALNGADGYKLAATERIDMIMLDVILPIIDGFSLLERLKNEEKTKKIPVIMLTNLETDEDKEKGKKLGALEYLIKADCTPAKIAIIIKKHLLIA